MLQLHKDIKQKYLQSSDSDKIKFLDHLMEANQPLQQKFVDRDNSWTMEFERV